MAEQEEFFTGKSHHPSANRWSLHVLFCTCLFSGHVASAEVQSTSFQLVCHNLCSAQCTLCNILVVVSSDIEKSSLHRLQTTCKSLFKWLNVTGITKIPYLPNAGPADVMCFKHYHAEEVGVVHTRTHCFTQYPRPSSRYFPVHNLLYGRRFLIAKIVSNLISPFFVSHNSNFNIKSILIRFKGLFQACSGIIKHTKHDVI